LADIRVLKIREFTYPTYVGGIEVCLMELCPALAGIGADVVLLTCAEKGLPVREQTRGVDTRRLDIMGIIGALTPDLNVRGASYGVVARAIFLMILPFHLVKLMKEERFDVLHVHCLCSLSAVSASFAGWLMRKPVLVTVHGTFLGYYNEALSFPLSWLVPSLERTLTRHLYCAKFLVEDRHAFRMLRRLGVPEEKVELLPYPGVDVQEFTCTRAENPAEHAVILSHGRLVRKRGVSDLIRAFPAIAKELPHCRLVVVGDGPDREQLIRLARDLNVLDRTDFVGLVPHERIAAHVQSSDVVVIPSLIEGHSCSVLEAMAAGRPVVATDVGGISEVISNGENGVLVEPGRPDQISAAVVKILRDREFAQKLGRNAVVTAREFDVKRSASEELKAYRKVTRVPCGRTDSADRRAH